MARNSTSPDAPRLRLATPVDLLAAIPYLLGFHPTDSLVLVGTRLKQVVFTMRVDLPRPGEPTAVLVAQLLDTLAGAAVERVAPVGFGPADQVEPVLAALGDALAERHLPVLDALRVTDGRYWSYTCVDDSCCPPEGRPYLADTSVVPATATLAGLVALPDRSDLARRIAPADGPDRAAMTAATRQAAARRDMLLFGAPDLPTGHGRLVAAGLAAVRTAGTRYQAGDRGLAHHEVAWLGVVLEAIRVRDEAWALADAGDLPSQLALWTDVVRRVEPRYAAAPAALLAFVAWQQGDGPFASVAVARALAADPDYPMAQLLSQALAGGLPPSCWHPVSAAELSRLDGEVPAPIRRPGRPRARRPAGPGSAVSGPEPDRRRAS